MLADIIGITTTFLLCQTPPSSLFNLWYLSTFWSVQRTSTVSLLCYFLVLSPVCVHSYHLAPFKNSRYFIFYTLPNEHCFCANIFHSATTWLIFSSFHLSPLNLNGGETHALCLSSLLFMLFVLSAWSCIVQILASISFFFQQSCL